MLILLNNNKHAYKKKLLCCKLVDDGVHIGQEREIDKTMSAWITATSGPTSYLAWPGI